MTCGFQSELYRIINKKNRKVMVTNVERKLQDNVLDDVKYNRKQVRMAIFGLVVGLWGPFIAALILLVLCVNGVVG